MAAIYEHDLIIELPAGMNIDYKGECELAWNSVQAMRGNIRIFVKLLLRSGDKINKEDGTYGEELQAVTFHGYRDVVKVLLDVGAPLHTAGSTGISRDAFRRTAEGEPTVGCTSLLPPSTYISLLRDYSPSRKGFKTDRGHTRCRMTFALMESTGHVRGDERGRRSRGSERPQLKAHFEYGRKKYAIEVRAATGRLKIVALLLEWKSDLGIAENEVLDSLEAATTYGNLQHPTVASASSHVLGIAEKGSDERPREHRVLRHRTNPG
ncbi:hypothetical protein HD806DRAFT_541936 [Xylariaceae sp. AK1471]|nr:hypothetical protein HD806DRAFT_541936 [Xylariaceae sp. AK1471]